jgi:hypothetical protein
MNKNLQESNSCKRVLIRQVKNGDYLTSEEADEACSSA